MEDTSLGRPVQVFLQLLITCFHLTEDKGWRQNPHETSLYPILKLLYFFYTHFRYCVMIYINGESLKNKVRVQSLSLPL
jgi:hypothetical protein